MLSSCLVAAVIDDRRSVMVLGQHSFHGAQVAAGDQAQIAEYVSDERLPKHSSSKIEEEFLAALNSVGKFDAIAHHAEVVSPA